MKKLLLILLSYFIVFCAVAQTDTGGAATTFDTGVIKSAQQAVRKVKKRITADTATPQANTDTVSVSDTITKPDSISTAFFDTAKKVRRDTVKNYIPAGIVKKPVDSIYIRLLSNPYITKAKPVYLVVSEKERTYKDEIFYLLCGLLVFLAFIKLVFNRYFRNIFRLFFQPSFRQKQTREQLLQNNLPSLLLNLFFIFSAGIYISFLLYNSQLTDLNLWWLLLYTNIALLVIYLGKFIFLNFAGWVFNVREAAKAYIFAVYLINKVLGVILIPFIVLIAFSKPGITNISVTISFLIIFVLFLYRYLVSYAPVHREMKVNLLHFLFYIGAFEIIPLMLIYKTLLLFLNNSH